MLHFKPIVIMKQLIAYTLFFVGVLFWGTGCAEQGRTPGQEGQERGSQEAPAVARQRTAPYQVIVRNETGTLSGVLAKVNNEVINSGGTAADGKVVISQIRNTDVLTFEKNGYKPLRMKFIKGDALVKMEIEMVSENQPTPTKRIFKGKVHNANNNNEPFPFLLIRDNRDNDPVIVNPANGVFNLDFGPITAQNNSSTIDFILPGSIVRLLFQGLQETVAVNVYLSDGEPFISDPG
jgi:hypothetical protein